MNIADMSLIPLDRVKYDLYCISSTSRFKKKKKKKKRLTYQPSQFSGQKGKQTFSFFRPYQMSWWVQVETTFLLFSPSVWMRHHKYTKTSNQP